MLSARTVFLNMVKKFPAWMDINKRPTTSVAGKYLQSIVDENDNIRIALDNFKSDFFLISYLGREDSVLAKAEIYQVGDIGDDIELISPALKLTENAKLFVEKYTEYALFQDGYIVIAPETLPKDKMCYYKHAKNSYGGKFVERALWNIFDEYALFLGLARYKDESNKDLMKRCLLVFKNRTNSSQEGLKNAIVNAISTQIDIDKDDIIFEKPDEKNLALPDDDFDSIYERLAEFNHDAFRNKRWDMDTWEHNFKKLAWVPHIWDTPVSVYQDGTGQNGDLKVRAVDKNSEAKTNIEIYGYKKSVVAAEEYVRKRSIQRKIPLTLKQYKDQLRVLDVDYSVTAEPAVKISPCDIKLQGKKKFSGRRTYKLSDIMQESGGASEEHLGLISSDGRYALRFTPKDEYSPINISQAVIADGDTNVNLLQAQDGFEFKGKALCNISNAIHIEKLTDANSYTNVQDTVDGIQLEPRCIEGEIVVDVSNNPGEAIHIVHTGTLSDFSGSEGFTANGFELEGNRYKASTLGLMASIDIDIDCACFAFEFLPPENNEQQGSATVTIKIDDTIDTINSGLWTSARKYSRAFNRLTHVQVHIQKASTSPVSFGNFKSAAYDVKYTFDNGIPISTPQAVLTPKVSGPNYMHIQLKTYDANSPIIKCIHVGDSTKNLVYEVEHDFKAGTWLDINSNCNVALYRKVNGVESLVKDKLKTGTLYKNKSEQTIRMAIDLSDTEEIQSSTIPVSKTTYKGKITHFISLVPGNELSEISIVGTGYTAARSYPLDKLLGLTLDEDVYVSHSIGGFVIKNKTTGEERLAQIEKSQIEKECTQFLLEGLPNGVTGHFVISAENTIDGGSMPKPFSYFYLIVTDDAHSIGYGQQRMVRQIVSRIGLPGNFTPALEDGKLYVYKITLPKEMKDQYVHADFEKNAKGKQIFEMWSLGRKEYGITIKADTDLDNIAGYMSEEQKINDYFIVSTQIPLRDTFTENGEEQEYARYIIEPPEGMEVDYTSENCGQDLVVEEDGFNKLWYAMVPHIDEVHCGKDIIPADKYSVISDGGIIVWNTNEYTGKTVSIYYTYNKPISLTYTSIDALYDLIGYNIEALTLMNKAPVVLEDVVDGEYRDIIIDGQIPDNMLASCSNSDFQATVSKNRVIAHHLGLDTANTVKTGYYYDQGKEYYFFEHQHKDKPVTEKYFETENADIMDDELTFSQPTSNHLLDSSMEGERLDVASYYDMSTHAEIDGISKLGAITACDSFHRWTGFDMDVELTGTDSNRKLKFTPQSKLAYALVEITEGVRKNTILSYAFSGGIKGTIMKELKASADSMRKSICCSHYAKVIEEDGIAHFIFDDETDESYRYFLMLNGEGIIDDIVLKEYDKDEDARQIHNRNIEKMHMEIEETKPAHYMETIAFDTHNNIMTDTEITSEHVIRTGSNVDYGVTKIFDSRTDMDKISNDENTNIRKGTEFCTENAEGKLTITGIKIPTPDAVRDVYVKINDVAIKGLNNFDVRISTGEHANYDYKEVRFLRKTNLASAYSVILGHYLQIEIKVPAKSVITNVEIYVRYAETGPALPVAVNTHGRLLTKIYDTLFSGNYKPARIEGTAESPENISFYIRGCRINKKGEAVWTNWYRYELDKHLMVTGDPHVFDGYRLFQFLFDFTSADVRLNIKNFIFEVV